MNKLPGFLIIGSMKCGTSSLHYYLNEHPEISMSKDKDIHFFSKKEVFEKGLNWYKDFFLNDELLKGETSATYVNFRDDQIIIPYRIKETLGSEIKIIMLVRDPIERIISHYVHDFSEGRIDKGLNDFVNDIDNYEYILDYSLYGNQLSNYLKWFDQSQILVVSSEELKEKRFETLKKIFAFLNVDKSFTSSIFENLKHVSKEKKQYNAYGKLFRRTPFFWRYTNYLPFTGKKITLEKLREDSIRVLKEKLFEDIKLFEGVVDRKFKEWQTYKKF